MRPVVVGVRSSKQATLRRRVASGANVAQCRGTTRGTSRQGSYQFHKRPPPLVQQQGSYQFHEQPQPMVQQQQQQQPPWVQWVPHAEDEHVRRRLAMLGLAAEMQQERAKTTDIEVDLQQVRSAAKDLKSGDQAQREGRYSSSSTREDSAVEEQSMAMRPDVLTDSEAHAASNSSNIAVRRTTRPRDVWGYEAVAENAGTGEVLWQRPETTAVGWHWLSERQRNNMRRAQERLEARDILAKRDAAAESFLQRMPGPGYVAESHPDSVRDGLIHPAELYGIGRWRRGEASSEHRGVQEMLAPSMGNLERGDSARDTAREAEVDAWERLYEQPRTTKQERASASALAHERSLMEEEWASLNRRRLHLLRSSIQKTHAHNGDVKESLALGKVWVAHLAHEVQSTKIRLGAEKKRQHELETAEEFRVQLDRQQGFGRVPPSRERDSGLRKAYIKCAAGSAEGSSGSASMQGCRRRKKQEAGWRSFDMCGPPL